MISYENIIVLSFILMASFLSLKIDQERNTCNSFFYFFNIYRHPKRYIGFEAKLTELTKYNNLLSIYEA